MVEERSLEDILGRLVQSYESQIEEIREEEPVVYIPPSTRTPPKEHSFKPKSRFRRWGIGLAALAFIATVGYYAFRPSRKPEVADYKQKIELTAPIEKAEMQQPLKKSLASKVSDGLTQFGQTMEEIFEPGNTESSLQKDAEELKSEWQRENTVAGTAKPQEEVKIAIQTPKPKVKEQPKPQLVRLATPAVPKPVSSIDDVLFRKEIKIKNFTSDIMRYDVDYNDKKIPIDIWRSRNKICLTINDKNVAFDYVRKPGVPSEVLQNGSKILEFEDYMLRIMSRDGGEVDSFIIEGYNKNASLPNPIRVAEIPKIITKQYKVAPGMEINKSRIFDIPIEIRYWPGGWKQGTIVVDMFGHQEFAADFDKGRKLDENTHDRIRKWRGGPYRVKISSIDEPNTSPDYITIEVTALK